MKVYLLVMCGGVGSRLYPVSRPSRPKQFADVLATGSSMLTDTVGRLAGLADNCTVVCLTSTHYRQAVASAMDALPDDFKQRAEFYTLTEPCMRNTAPAVLYGTAFVRLLEAQRLGCSVSEAEEKSDAVIAVLPSDHYIGDPLGFCSCVGKGLQFASSHSGILTIGITPTYPATGYGYIHTGEPVPTTAEVMRVTEFKEKPDLPLAERYLQTGEYLWNAGMFLFSLQSGVEAFRTYCPETYNILCGQDIKETVCQCSSASPGRLDDMYCSALAPVYERCENISFDYAVLEKSSSVCVLPGSFDWSDLGGFRSLWEHSPQDADANAFIGCTAVAASAHGNYVRTVGSDKLVVLCGVSNLTVVDTGDALLVCPTGDEANLKNAVSQIKERGLTQYL